MLKSRRSPVSYDSLPDGLEIRGIAWLSGIFADLDGQVWSNKSGRWRRLQGSPVNGGYLRITILIDEKRKQFLVNRLVCEAFHGPPIGRQLARHLDGISSNNKPGNLAWGSDQDNSDDSRKHGAIPVGELAGRATITKEIALSIIHDLNKGLSLRKAAIKNRVSISLVAHIRSHRAWKSLIDEVGHKWTTGKGWRKKDQNKLEGESHGMAKLTDALVSKIFTRIESGKTDKQISKEFKISVMQSWRIRTRKAWKNHKHWSGK